jgi:hypothetical protein
MEHETPMILPKGIVVNTKDIYHEVAKYGLVPADRVWEIWRGKSHSRLASLGAGFNIFFFSQSTPPRTRSYRILLLAG